MQFMKLKKYELLLSSGLIFSKPLTPMNGIRGF